MKSVSVRSLEEGRTLVQESHLVDIYSHGSVPTKTIKGEKKREEKKKTFSHADTASNYIFISPSSSECETATPWS